MTNMALNGLLDNIAGMWPIDQNIFDVLDVVPLIQHPIRHEAGATITITGKFTPGLAKNFGTDSANRLSYADIAGKFFNPGDNSFTVMAWVKTPDANNPYLAKWDSRDATPNRSWLLWQRQTTHRFEISELGVVSETQISIANPGVTNWQLVIAGFDAVNEEIFMSLDGATKITTAHTGGASATAEVNLTMGWFRGTIFIMGGHEQDETAYWAGRVLSDADCSTIWAGGAGLRMTQWDATVPVADGTGILTGLKSYYNLFEASGGDRIDLHSGDNDVSETGAGAPIDQGTGLPGVANTTANADLSSNPGSVEYLEKTSPVGMGGGSGSFTVAGFFEFDPKRGQFQGLISRWLASTDQRQFMLYINDGPSALWQFNANPDGMVGTSVGAVAPENFTSAPVGFSITRFCVGWYDGDADTTNIQLSDGPIVSMAGPSTVFNSSIGFQIGHTNNFVTQPLVGGAAFVGYWTRVLTQVQRTFLYNFFGGRTYAALVAANGNGGGGGGEEETDYNYYWARRTRQEA